MSRVATVGISMGGMHSWWLAALDTRIRVCVNECSLGDFHTLLELNGQDCHGVYYYVPGLLKHFTAGEIIRLIAPRPHLSMNGRFDVMTPSIGYDRIDKEVRGAYDNQTAGEWQMKIYSSGHYETSEMRSEVLAFLKKWL